MRFTLPTAQRSHVPGVTTGRFERSGDSVVLVDANGNAWPAADVDFVTGLMGGAHDGPERMPRPFARDVRGKVVVEGDVVALTFVADNPQRPLILGVVRAAARDAFLQGAYGAAGYDGDMVRWRGSVIDSAGAQTGQRVDLRLLEDGEGTVDIRATGKVVIRIHHDTESTSGSTTITAEDGIITIDAQDVRLGGASPVQFVALAGPAGDNDETLRAAHNALVTTFLAHVHPIVSPTATGPTVSTQTPIGALQDVAAEHVKAQ